MTLQADPFDSFLNPSDEIPVVICIALDHGHRRRLAAMLEGSGVLMFARDMATARSLLGRHASRRRGEPGPTPAPDVAPASRQLPAALPAAPEADSTVVRLGELEIDRVRHRARWRDTPLPLTPRERELLACLAGRPFQVWTYRELYAAAWPGRYLDPGPVHAAVKRLRRKLREAAVPVQVNAIRGIGYELGDTTG